MRCLFCNLPEAKYKPDPQVDFICGSCVTILADAEQEDLKRAYQKALDEGYLRKVSALESFIIPEGKDEQIRPKSRSFSNRKRNARVFRDEKRTTRRSKKKQRIAVHSD